MAKRGVAVEYVPVATRQGELVGICPESMEYGDYALSLLNSDWKTHAEEVFEAYRVKMPMREVMENILDHTLPGLTQVRSSDASVSIKAIAKVRTFLTTLFHKRINLVEQMGEPPAADRNRARL